MTVYDLRCTMTSGLTRRISSERHTTTKLYHPPPLAEPTVYSRELLCRLVPLLGNLEGCNQLKPFFCWKFDKIIICSLIYIVTLIMFLILVLSSFLSQKLTILWKQKSLSKEILFNCRKYENNL